MKAFIAKSPIGIFAFSENGELLHYKLFSRNPEKANVEMGKSIQEFSEDLKGYEIVEDETAYRFLTPQLREFALSLGFVNNNAEFNRFMIDFCIQYSKSKISSLISKDKFLIQATNALDDLEKIYNLMDQRLYEWFSLHYPEIKQRNIAELVIKYGKRENFPNFKSSNGIDLAEADEKTLKEYAKFVIESNEEKKRLERYVTTTVKEVAPNLSSLLDAILAARMLALAGSLERLARMPASTIQLLGSEKALFRHLKGGGRSPKFGIIYNSSYIQNAPKGKQGKVARIVSSKLMLAAKIDFYSGRFEPKLKKEMDEEIKKVKLKFIF